jgi:hypothetical protein
VVYLLAMSDAEPDDDDMDEAEAIGFSLAIPPLYVLSTATGCPTCRKAVGVYALGCPAFHDAEDDYLVKAFHFLNFVIAVPQALTELLKEKCPSYFLDREDGSEEPYLMNHCGCGAKIDDDFLHGDVGAAFWPGHSAEYEHMVLFRLPITEPLPVRCSYAVGGGEYLSLARTLAW